MNFFEAVSSGFRNYINFSGRASRSEFLFFMLFGNLVAAICAVADFFLFYPIVREGLFPLESIAELGFALPAIAVSTRRLHDIDRTGWWFLIAFTVVGTFWLLVWWCNKGKTGRNRFGPDPLAHA